ncbi:peptidoglycan editing factor PgeF [Paenibacillus sp. SC116]|nr:peptidoglycan editing factor PgeF [Paenibacillus sp. SC116]MCR8845736.1 peptidoglycan editing factor PgeF [Paenibacillus sp. SC116]
MMEPFQFKHLQRAEETTDIETNHDLETGAPAVLELKKWTSEMPELTAGFTTRRGGVSQGGRDSLNCALHVQDDPSHVVENRKRLASVVNMPFDAWTCAEQVHGQDVYVVKAADKGRGRLEREDAIPDSDALITNEAGIWLTSFYADCVPLLFVDPVTRAIGVAHAGWKGTVGKIAERTVEAMQRTYGSELGNIRAAIGPSIGACCYEVDDRVIQPIQRLLNDLPEEANAALKPTNEGRAMLDLREINRQLLIQAGILSSHIECTTWCTGCHTQWFYSHRVEGGGTGRMASWVGWKKG